MLQTEPYKCFATIKNLYSFEKYSKFEMTVKSEKHFRGFEAFYKHLEGSDF
jgi:hypothetical protein